MSVTNGMFATESVTEQDFTAVEDFFDTVVSDVKVADRSEQGAVCAEKVDAQVKSLFATDLSDLGACVVEDAEQDEPMHIVRETVAVEQNDVIAVIKQQTNEETVKSFETVEEVINDNIVIVPEEINITKYKGGTVLSREQIEQLSYPCVYIHADTLPAYKATALKAILSRGEFDGDSVIYVCYLDYQGTIMQLGYLDNKVMREMIQSSIFSDMNVVVYLSENKQIKGKYLNALCAV